MCIRVCVCVCVYNIYIYICIYVCIYVFVGGLVNLQRLDAYKNSLSSVTGCIAKMGNLKEFNIFNNQVTEIPAQVSFDTILGLF